MWMFGLVRRFRNTIPDKTRIHGSGSAFVQALRSGSGDSTEYIDMIPTVCLFDAIGSTAEIMKTGLR